ncbi:MAG: amidohydrolase family protein [Nitrospirae bacterium]|nr:amidohydrolase family protein [Nitrospirota bacterium]
MLGLPKRFIIGAKFVVHDAKNILRSGGFLVDSGRVVEVRRFNELCRLSSSIPFTYFSDHVIIPGLVNAHTHIELSALGPPSGPAEGFLDWLIQLVRARSALDPVKRASGFILGLNAALASGTTCIGDIESLGFPPTPAEIESRQTILARSGLRAVSFLEAIGLDPAEAGKRASCVRRGRPQPGSTTDKAHRRLLAGLSLHAPYSVSDELAARVASLARRYSLPVSVYLLETPFERTMPGRLRDFRRYCATFNWNSSWLNHRPSSPLDWLGRHGLLNQRTLAVHGVHLNRREIATLARKKISLVLCLRSNLYLHGKLPPIAHLVAQGVPLAMGTDSLASNSSLSLWDEMRAILDHGRPILTPAAIFSMATEGGARALGLAGVAGALRPGYRADFVIVRPGFRVDNARGLFYNLIRSVREAHVQGVAVDGRMIFTKDLPL